MKATAGILSLNGYSKIISIRYKLCAAYYYTGPYSERRFLGFTSINSAVRVAFKAQTLQTVNHVIISLLKRNTEFCFIKPFLPFHLMRINTVHIILIILSDLWPPGTSQLLVSAHHRVNRPGLDHCNHMEP